MAKKKSSIDPALLDELLKDVDPQKVFDSDGLLGELKQALAQRMLDAELDHHLDQPDEKSAGNHRNGHSKKTVITENGAMPLSIPRDRQGRFEPQLIEKYRRRFPGFDEKIISMYGRGMTTREIQGHVRELYGLDISPELVSIVTDAVNDEVKQWQSRPLETTYAIVFFDAIRVKIRDEGTVKNKAVYLAIGITCEGLKEVLGLWIEQTEGAKFWLRVMNELKARGTEDVLIAVVDGLKGFPEAIEAVFPQALVQTCIVHLIRYSLQFASWKDRKQLAAALRPIYQALDAQLAEAALQEFEQSEWGQKYPQIAAAWRRQWDRVIVFFDFPDDIRRMIYTTNAIESLNSTVRKAVRTRGHFPNDQAASKLIYLAINNVASKWQRPPRFWHQAKTQLAIKFEDRFTISD
jgi:putative transposase